MFPLRFKKLNLDMGEAALEPHQIGGNKISGNCVRDRQPDFPNHFLMAAAGDTHGLFDSRHNVQGMLEKLVALVGKHHTVRMAGEKLGVEHLFERFKCGSDCRLGNVEIHGGL